MYGTLGSGETATQRNINRYLQKSIDEAEDPKAWKNKIPF